MNLQLDEFFKSLVEKFSNECVEAFGDHENVYEFREFVSQNSQTVILETLEKSLGPIGSDSESLSITFAHEGTMKTLDIRGILDSEDVDELTKTLLPLGLKILSGIIEFIRKPAMHQRQLELYEAQIEKLKNRKIAPSHFFNGIVDKKLEAPLSKIMSTFEDSDAMKKITGSINIFQKK